MDSFQFYNSLSKQVEPFLPKDMGKVRIYNCGPTVYKRQHLGNMRRFIFSDVLRRSLEFAGYEVREVTNITDVGHLTEDDLDQGEDKIEKAAKARELTPEAIAQEQTQLFFDDIQALNIQPAHIYPKASQHIPQMQQIIEKLIENKHAYVTETGVYYDVTSFPSYGKLSGNTIEALNAGARIEVRDEKHHPSDFALWKFDDAHLQKWDSTWGVGFPGWHVECSAMSIEYLGTDIDIHTGGIDNKFPHHENEIAQSEGAYPERFVRTWMHNGHLNVQGEKLSKRDESTILTIDTLRSKGFNPLAFRLLVLSAHYRSKLDFSWEALTAASQILSTIEQLLRIAQSQNISVTSGTSDPSLIESFQQALEQDLNTAQALAIFMKTVTQAHAALASGTDATSLLASLSKMDMVIGVMTPLLQSISHESVPQEIHDLVTAREEARKNKQFGRADELRSDIEAKGFALEDTPSGPRVKPQ